jgi:hypothetical protein
MKEKARQINLEKTVTLRLSRKKERNTIMKISGSKIKANTQIYLFQKCGREKQ